MILNLVFCLLFSDPRVTYDEYEDRTLIYTELVWTGWSRYSIFIAHGNQGSELMEPETVYVRMTLDISAADFLKYGRPYPMFFKINGEVIEFHGECEKDWVNGVRRISVSAKIPFRFLERVSQAKDVRWRMASLEERQFKQRHFKELRAFLSAFRSGARH